MDPVRVKDMLLFLEILANKLAFSNKLTKEVNIRSSLNVLDSFGKEIPVTKSIVALYKHLKFLEN